MRSGEEGDKATFVDKTSTDLYYKKDRLSIKGLVYGALMPLSTIFQLYRGGFNQRVNRLDHICSLGWGNGRLRYERNDAYYNIFAYSHPRLKYDNGNDRVWHNALL